ncbi:fumarylacetoacetate hydrolase [Paraburkholderia sp. BL6665CI2N2]|uniref:fumarylacetoacetase n=1 Tax=Paraburkholderia sp. BL6665CI2N2 TaxID=1938806 RepID=UPI001064EF24|nr:fumarylacetoacetase [Paraburkholderia sp. BL6665CI2N2]TDY26961.1 fumarylacetoacetate hydrolase [Paraburkholderia sp. BL6665CI2N2]
MQHTLNQTHDPAARSWVESANAPACDFPIQNLPFSVFRRKHSDEAFRGAVAIGDQVIDIGAWAARAGLNGIAGEAARACAQPVLNEFFSLGPSAWRAVRHALFAALHERAPSDDRAAVEACLVPQSEVEYGLPAQIGDYTDFYTSIHHATNISKLLGLSGVGANFKSIPTAYHGRVSSIGLSGQRFRRPAGQIMLPHKDTPIFSPSRKLDYELELGIYIGQGNAAGEPIGLDQADSHVFGLCLLNDWSARDIQAWEMQPLGPFLAKNFATTISPWIVTMEALAPFRLPLPRPDTDGKPLPYLDSDSNSMAGAIDIQLEVCMETSRHKAANLPAARLSLTSFRHQYWSIAQMVAHHTGGGCNLRAGDLLGSGTISGPEKSEAGALMELARNASEPVTLNTGEKRSYVEDGDDIILRGYCEKAGFARIGFGESRGEVLPAQL